MKKLSIALALLLWTTSAFAQTAQWVQPYAPLNLAVSGDITSAMTGTTTTQLIAAPPAGMRNYITSCTPANSHATVSTLINLQDGSGGTTFYSLPAAAVFASNASVTFPMPLRQPTLATALFVANVTTGSSTFISCSGFIAP